MNFQPKTVFLEFLRLQVEFQYGTNAVDLRISSIFIYQKVVLDVRVPLSKNVFKMFEFGPGHVFVMIFYIHILV